MKKILPIIALCATTMYAQKVTYSYSNEFENVKKHRDKGFYKFSNDEYAEVYIQKDEKDLVFQVFDKTFQNVTKTVTAEIPEFEKHPTDEGFFSLKDDYFWFFSTWDRSTETERLFALPFDKKKLKFADKEIKLIETGRLTPPEKYTYNYSADSTKMLITYRKKPEEKRDKLNKDIIGFNLFDDKMKKIYAGEIEMPYSEADMNNKDFEVDSRGNIYMLAEVKINNAIDGEVDREHKDAMRYELMRVNQSNNTIQAIKINLDNKYVSTVLLSEDLNRNIVIVGYYSDRKYSTTVEGAFLIRLELDDNSAVKNLKTTYCPIPVETLKAFESEYSRRKMDKKEDKGKLEANNLNFRKVVFYPDGSLMVIGEESWVDVHTTRNGSSTSTTYEYHYNNIIVIKADKDGKTLWCNKIPKNQSGSNIRDLGFHHHIFKGEDLFLYLDNAKNIDLPLTEKPAPHRAGAGGYLTCVKIDKQGKMTKQSLFDIRKEKIKLYPSSFESMSENLILDRLKAGGGDSKVLKLEIK